MTIYSMSVDLPDIAQAAKQVNDHIHDRIKKKDVDPDNVVILIGEIHAQMTHQYFQKKLIADLHTTTALQNIFYENSVLNQDLIERDRKAGLWRTLIDKDSVYRNENISGLHGALKQDIPVKLIDSPRYVLKDDDVPLSERFIIKDTLSEAFLQNYKDNPIIEPLLRNYSDVLVNKDEKYFRATSLVGKIKRDMHMMDHIVQETDKNPGMSVAIIGRTHMLDQTDPARPTLPEMLLANGKDVVNVRLSFGARDGILRLYHENRDQLQQDKERQYQRLYNTDVRPPLADINVEINGMGEEGWAGFVRLHKINRDEIPMNMRIIAGIKNILG